MPRAMPRAPTGDELVDDLRGDPRLVDVLAVEASTTSMRLGKCRYRVPTPTPACFAMASIDAPPPCWANTSRAAARRRS